MLSATATWGRPEVVTTKVRWPRPSRSWGDQRSGPPDPATWRDEEMRDALATRNIGRVFKLLQRIGISQRRIAALTGQSQSEISEILKGRQVVSYDVLVRIADGLGVPRGLMGLAHEDPTDPRPTQPLAPVLDAETGRWMVRLPVFVDDYDAAMHLAGLTVGSPIVLAPAAEDSADGGAAVEGQWHLDARAALAASR